ncbi:MAG: MATE family efflux transporter [Schwartzia sp.]|nr:MATE family efflux transporter [Schwartzia sp. (in: firmicutes)]
MRQTHSCREKARQLLAVLLPIFVSQTAIFTTGFFDTVMAGHISQEDLAGVAVAANLLMPFFCLAIGIISGLTPVLAQLYGAGKKERIRRIVQQGFYWSLGLAAVFLLLGYAGVPLLLPHLALAPRVETIASRYLVALSFGIVPFFLSLVLRNLMDSHGATRLTMMITLAIVPINVALNYVFMFGPFGLPAFGGAGAGMGSAVAFALDFVLYALTVTHTADFARYRVFSDFPSLDGGEWKKQLSVGLPIGSTMFCEASIFGVVGLLMAAYGTTVMAAHQAAMNFASVAYVVPLSISLALTIFVGYETGARRPADARQYTRLSWGLSLTAAGSLAALAARYADGIAGFYTSDPAVRERLVVFLGYAVVMQLADGVNAPLQGALRGYKDVRAAFYLAMLSYWGIGLPAGWALARFTSLGPYGYWAGLISGLLLGTVCQMFRLRVVERRHARPGT